MHGANHNVSCDKNQLVYNDRSNPIIKGKPKIYHLNKAYTNPYQWSLPGIPYKDWLKAVECIFYDYEKS